MKRYNAMTRIILIIGLLIGSLTPATTRAQTPGFDVNFYSGNNIEFTDPRSEACTGISGSSGTTGVTANLPAETISYLDGRNVKQLAEQNKDRYLYAEKETNIPWQAIAALHYREASMANNRSVYNGAVLGSGVNVDGQMVVGDANQDAARAANHFKMLAKQVYSVDITKGSLTTEEWGNAFLSYNRGSLYKNNSKTYLESPYVMNGYDDSHMNMRWVGGAADPGSSTRGGGPDGNKAGALAVMAYLGGVSLSGGSSECGPGSGGLGVSADGFIFPLRTTKAAIKAGSSNASGNAKWCYTASTNCHGSYTAADIHVATGTPVVAAIGGEVTMAGGSASSANGFSVSINASDGVTYFYTHMGALGTVSVGQTVKAGDELGSVGTAAQAQGTAPHVHFDAGTGYRARPACSREGGCPIRDQLIDTQPTLVQAYGKLPE